VNTPHCLDIEVDDMDETIAHHRRVALRDGVFDAEERLIYERLTAHRSNISDFSRRRTAAESYERNGPTRHTKSLFKESGYGLVDLDKERRARRSNVVEFHQRRSGGEPA